MDHLHCIVSAQLFKFSDSQGTERGFQWYFHRCLTLLQRLFWPTNWVSMINTFSSPIAKTSDLDLFRISEYLPSRLTYDVHKNTWAPCPFPSKQLSFIHTQYMCTHVAEIYSIFRNSENLRYPTTKYIAMCMLSLISAEQYSTTTRKSKRF